VSEMTPEQALDNIELALMKSLDYGWDLAELEVYGPEVAYYQQVLVSFFLEVLFVNDEERTLRVVEMLNERYAGRRKNQEDRTVAEAMAGFDDFLKSLRPNGEVDN
jgi:hypothetical protein